MTEESIKFNECEGRDSFFISDDTKVLNIFPSRTSQKIENSSKVKLKTVVDYSWDAQTGIGRLTAIHYSGKFIAYCVKLGANGAIRLLDMETKQRALMRGNKGLIRDLEFMYYEEDVVLGFIDEYGTFYIYRVLQQADKLDTVLLLQVELEGSPNRLDCRRFIWCRYVPETASETANSAISRDSPAYQFSIVEDDVAYVANLLSIIAKHGEGVHKFPELKGSYLSIREHSLAVTDASFAPDGTAVATASRDGTVKFFQIYFLSESGGEPRCLYSWAPHDGEPVSRIFFLDDHSLTNNDSESQYWKFVITAGPNMNELKIWNCVKWECMQTLRFSTASPSALRMEMNVTANFFVLSDSYRKVLYVFHVEHDESNAHWKWITEFSVPVNILGFNVVKAEFYNKRQIAARELENFFSEDLNNVSDACIVDVVLVQPKSMMEATMAFLPPVDRVENGNDGRSHSRISFDDTVSFKDDDEKDSEDEDEPEDEDKVDQDEEPERRSRSMSPRQTPTKIPSPKSAPSIPRRDKSPIGSPLTNQNRQRSVTPTSVIHLTKQLSSLIGVGMNQSSAPPPLPNPFLSSMTLGNEAVLPIRIRTSSANGNLSNSSSPSREVEEILSPKNTETCASPPFRVQSSNENGFGFAVVHKPEITTFHLHDSGFGVGISNQDLDQEGNLIDFCDKRSESPRQMKLPPKSKSLGGGELGIRTASAIPDVLEQVNSIMDMMKAQAHELKELRSEVSRLNAVQFMTPSRPMDDSGVAKALEKYTSLNDAHLRRTEETIISTVRALEKRGMPKGFTENVTLDLAHAIKTEIESTVLPQLLKIFEPVCLHLNSEIDNLIKGAETKVKQQMGQMVNSHDFKSMLRDQVGNAVKAVCDGAMSDVFCTSVIPNFEKSLQGLFETVNQTFMKGTKEYMTGVETSVRASKSQHDELQDSIKRQLLSMQDTLTSVMQVELECQLRQIGTGIQQGLLTQFQDSVSREISKLFSDQQRFLEASVFPRTMTPGPSDSTGTSPQLNTPMDPVVRLSQLSAMVEAGNIAEAFTKVANLGDHQILMALAGKVSPSMVFTRELPTVAHVAIIQQMAVDIMTFTEIKILYLQTAVGTLNLCDPKVLRSLSRIVPVFQNSVTKFAALNPDSPFLGNLKFLEMAFVGIGNRSQQQQSTLTPIPSNIPRPQH